VVVTGRSTYRIGLVCLGNICRSPMAEVVLTAKLADAGLDDRVEVASSGTGDWHMGDPIDRRAAAHLAAEGYDGSTHRAQRFDVSWFDEYDLLLAMDDANAEAMLSLARDGADRGRVQRFREFDPLATDDDRAVPDPFYGEADGFAAVFAIVDRTSDALVKTLVDKVVNADGVVPD
jgi:protein-tyrosine phosphatase